MIRIILSVLVVIMTIFVTAHYYKDQRATVTTVPADLSRWQWQEVGSQVNGQALTDDGALRTDLVRTDGALTHAQLYHRGIVLKQGHEYRVVFSAKADKERRITIQAARDSLGTYPYAGTLLPPPDNPHTMGLNAEVPIDTSWTDHEITFTATDTDGHPNRLPQFLLGNTTGSVWIKNITIHEL